MNIIRSEDTCFGRPRIEGSRLQVFDVISELFYAESMEEVMEERGFSPDDLRQVVAYCRNMECKILSKPYEKYCSKCILGTQQEGIGEEPINLKKLDEDIYIDEGRNVIVFGTKEELEEEFYGKPGWAVAAQVHERWMD